MFFKRNQPRDSKGRFIPWRRVLIVSMIFGIPIAAINVGALEWIKSESDKMDNQVIETVVQSIPHAYADTALTMEEKVAAWRKDIVVRLTDCENGNYTEDDAIVIWDNNSGGTLEGRDIPSYGELQWKVDTIVSEAKARDGSVLTPKQAKLLAFDTKKAQELADFTIFVNKGKGIYHWYNCANNTKYFPNGAKAEVDAIKKLIQ